MASNTLESITAWMKDPRNDVMLGWDSIAVMDRAEVNHLLLEEYISRFSSETYLRPISGEVTLVNGRSKESIHDFILDAPRLAFSDNDLSKSHATLTCAILGGTQLTLSNNVDTWETTRVILVDPLQGPRLTLDLSLDRVPGIVDLDGRVTLDLRESDNFILTFAETIDDRKLGGDFFKDWFNTLPDSQRVWTLGFIAAGNVAQLRPESFKMRTQTNPAASLDPAAPDYGDGAVLVFIRMRGNDEGGDIPAQYRYLIPDDPGKGYSATVLFDSTRLASIAFPIEPVAQALPAVFDSLVLKKDFDGAGRMVKAQGISGYLRHPGVIEYFPFSSGGEEIIATVDYYELLLDLEYRPAANIGSIEPLLVELTDHGSPTFSWTVIWFDSVILSLPGTYNYVLDTWRTLITDLRCTYLFAEDGKGGLVLKPSLDITSSVLRLNTREYPPVVNGKPVNSPYLSALIERLRVESSDPNLDVLKSRIRDALQHSLTPDLSVTSLIHELIRLNYNETIVADVFRAPRDIAVFGRINPLRADFSISPVEHVMVSGSVHGFVVEPKVANLRWEVKCLQGDPHDYGGINAAGMYYAPTLSGDTSFSRVRVTATHYASGFASSALVTVVARPVNLNPLIQVCDVNRSAELAAGEMNRGELLWSLKDAVIGESGQLVPSILPDGDHAYIPRQPALPDKTYVLDEVVATSKSNPQAHASAWVLVTQKIPFLTIKLAANAHASAGQVQLQAFANGNPVDPSLFEVSWELGANATGTVSDTGLYSAAQKTTDRFALIFAWTWHPLYGRLDGHIILPLPLARFAQELDMMIDKTAPLEQQVEHPVEQQADKEHSHIDLTGGDVDAGHSAESLLAWMKDTTRLRGWDAVIALDGATVNGMLDERYRLSVGQGLSRPVADGSITIPGTQTQTSHFFSGCVFGAPALSFRHSSMERASLAWRLALLGGLHTVVEDVHGQQVIQRIAAYQPLNALALDLDLVLDSQGPNLRVDLGQGTDATLDFAGTPAEQREIGKFFQDWFSSLDEKERVFELGVFSEPSNELLQVRRIDVRTQLENPEAGPASGRGALLLFTTMEYGVTGGLPGDDADFRYLIPNDDKLGYTATAVFSAHALHRAAFGHAAMQMLRTHDFQFIYGDDRPLKRMIANTGLFSVPAGEYQSADFAFRSEPFYVQAFNLLDALTIDFDYTQVTQNWRFPCNVDFSYQALGGDQWHSYSATFNVSLRHEFHLDADGNDEQAMEGQLYTPYLYDEQVTPVGGLAHVMSSEEQQQINEFVAYTVKHALLQGFSQALDASGAERFLADWQLSGEQSLQPVRRQMPYDLAVFGRIVAPPLAFSIVEQQAVVVAGETLQLTTEPPRERLEWTVRVPSGGNKDDYGTVNKQQGLYQAPALQSLPQHVQRVLVEAKDLETLQTSTVLLAVVASAIGVNPLIEVCNHDERIKLSASSSRGSALRWEITNYGAGSGTLEDDPAGGKFYVAGPGGRDKTYVLDEIAVSDGRSVQLIKVLVLRHAPALVVRVKSLDYGTVVLQAFANEFELEAEWSCAGPGSIESDGLNAIYTGSGGAPERFVVIFAAYEDPWGFGTLQGHLILPLPLMDSPDVLRALAGPSERSQGAARREM